MKHFPTKNLTCIFVDHGMLRKNEFRDVVIDKQGKATVIDFNDWPSFSRCREEAARAMALAVVRRIKQKGKMPLLPLGSHAGVRAIIFDYGGTLDTGGTHWGKQLWHAYQRQQVLVDEQRR